MRLPSAITVFISTILMLATTGCAGPAARSGQWPRNWTPGGPEWATAWHEMAVPSDNWWRSRWLPVGDERLAVLRGEAGPIPLPAGWHVTRWRVDLFDAGATIATHVIEADNVTLGLMHGDLVVTSIDQTAKELSLNVIAKFTEDAFAGPPDKVVAIPESLATMTSLSVVDLQPTAEKLLELLVKGFDPADNKPRWWVLCVDPVSGVLSPPVPLNTKGRFFTGQLLPDGPVIMNVGEGFKFIQAKSFDRMTGAEVAVPQRYRREAIWQPLDPAAPTVPGFRVSGFGGNPPMEIGLWVEQERPLARVTRAVVNTSAAGKPKRVDLRGDLAMVEERTLRSGRWRHFQHATWLYETGTSYALVVQAIPEPPSTVNAGQFLYRFGYLLPSAPEITWLGWISAPVSNIGHVPAQLAMEIYIDSDQWTMLVTATPLDANQLPPPVLWQATTSIAAPPEFVDALPGHLGNPFD